MHPPFSQLKESDASVCQTIKVHVLLQGMWLVTSKGNEKRDTAYPAALGNRELGQSRKGYSLT